VRRGIVNVVRGVKSARVSLHRYEYAGEDNLNQPVQR
jgi:hypothetical protein